MKAKMHYTNGELTKRAIRDNLKNALLAMEIINSGNLSERAMAIEKTFALECLRRAKAMAGRNLARMR